MKKIYFALIILVVGLYFALPALADGDDLDSGSFGSLMDDTKAFENPGVGQKQITDEDFQKTIDQLKAKRDRKKIKKQKRQGSTYNDDQDSDKIKDTAENNSILCIPLELINGDGSDIPIGHYKVTGKQEGNNYYLDFYQAYKLIAEVPAIETDNDFDEPDVNFVKLIPYNDERIKIIYGSMDFNAYTFIKIKNKITDKN